MGGLAFALRANHFRDLFVCVVVIKVVDLVEEYQSYQEKMLSCKAFQKGQKLQTSGGFGHSVVRTTECIDQQSRAAPCGTRCATIRP